MKQEQSETTVTGTKRRKSRVHSAKEKTQAVLSLWSGRRNTASLTRALEVPWAMISSWEKRALTGMLTALDPMWQKEKETQPVLPKRLEKLIEKVAEPSMVTEEAAK